MMRPALLAVAVVISLACASTASAQMRPPFFNQQPALFDPEISVLTTGVLNDVQATVSPDRKYVTLNMRASNSELVALREFTFQTGAGGGAAANLPTGFAGDPAPVLLPPAGTGNAANGSTTGSPSIPASVKAAAVKRDANSKPTVLTREGMTLIARANLSPAPVSGAP